MIATLALLAGLAAPGAPVAAPDGAAVAIERVAPEYPKEALERRVDGCVVLSFTIGADGRPADVQVLESRPQGTFDAATLKVFGQWRFQPPPRPGRYAQAVNFRLKDREPANACKPLPTFAALNPDAPPATREVRLLEKVMPQLPRDGEAADGGCVTVRFQIKYDGFVGEVQVLEARPESLAAPTVAALKQWHFQSFPPPDMWAVQTFNFTPEVIRLPDNVVRASYAALDGADLRNQGCAGTAPAAPAVKAATAGGSRP